MKEIDEIATYKYVCMECRIKWIHNHRVCWAWKFKKKSPKNFCPYHEGKPKWKLMDESDFTPKEKVILFSQPPPKI